MINALEVLAALAALILLHETGHFLACRLFGIEVEEFGIGIPPRATALFERNGTLYTLNWLPLGGFVRPKGEGDPSVPGSIESASPWARLGVYLAGPAMNLLIGVVLFVLIFVLYGQPVTQHNGIQVVTLVAGAPAEQAGVQICDVITAIDGHPLDNLETLVSYTHAHLGEEVVLSIVRQGQKETLTVTPRETYPADEGPMGIGIAYPAEWQPASLGEALIRGLNASWATSLNIAALPVKLISGAISYEEGRPLGLKGMVDAYSGIKSGDLLACTPPSMNILYFLASITLSLAVFNLLPFPALDGGRVLFLLPELLFGRRIPAKYENLINMLGFLILLIFLVIINIQDFVKPVF